MFLKNWTIIIILLVVAVGLGWYALQANILQNPTTGGVTPQGGTQDTVTAIAALAGAITTLVGAVSGAAMKFIEYKKASLAVEGQQIANEKARKDLESS